MTERESVYLWSTTAATNASADPNINFAEGQLPSTVNNSARAEMAAWARWQLDNNGSLTTAGSANAYTLTINGTQTAYATGHTLKFKASFSNTGAATLNVTNVDAAALGAKAIRGPGDVALVTGQMISGGVYILRYDTAANSAAGAWLLLNPSPATAAATVTSIAGNTGAFTLANGIDNSTNQIQLTAARRTLPSVQTFLSGSGTYTTPANVLWIRLRMAAGGGGGAGTNAGGTGGTGGSTTFGTSLHTCTGGTGGAAGSSGGSGGTATIGAGGAGLAVTGGSGNGYNRLQTASTFTAGTGGGSNPLGGAGGGGNPAVAGTAAATNTGGGGGGAGSNNDQGGAGGGAGGYLDIIIASPAATYAYAVGAAGTAGTSGGVAAGGAGGSGGIWVEEHYGS